MPVTTARTGIRTAPLCAALLLACLLAGASTCQGDTSWSQPLVQRNTVRAGTQGFMYVGDLQRKLYWPNQSKYVDAIPKSNRVWIRDANTLKQFKGYRAGKL